MLAALLGLALAALPAAADPEPPLGSTEPVAVSIPAPDSLRLRILPTGESAGGTTWYYAGRPYGSESLVHPFRMILNGGLGILQFDNRNNQLSSLDFHTGMRNVRMNLAHPVRAIEVEGWWAFFQREIIPISFNTDNAQYWPNYTLHLIGGGMSYAMMGEWYEQHGYSRPRVWAGFTLAAYHVLNEVVENNDYVGPTTDPVADLYIFDPAGIVLFSHEGVNEFFSGKLHLRDWSYQPAFDFARGTIENQGQNFSLKVPVPRTKRWSLFYYFGTHGEGGLTYTKANRSAFSVAGGFRAKELVDVTAQTKTVQLVPSVGFFYDREGSLLFSAMWSNTSRYKTRVNVYPGLLRQGRFSPGMFLALDRGGEAVFGVDLRLTEWIPLGIAFTK